MLSPLRNLTLQSVPPSAAHLALSVENFVTRDIKIPLDNKHLLIAFSGGVDSMALLVIFYLLRHRLHLTLSAAHLNHSMREEAPRDQKFCQKVCAKLSIPYFTTTVDIPQLCNNSGLEETARTARYAYFASLQESVPYDYIITGHQLNDLAEDCCMRLIRGTGWPALGGMSAYVQSTKILRPLLLESKERLEDLLTSLHIPHVVDATNSEPFSLRNRIRARIIPEFIAENPRFLERIAALWWQAQLDKTAFSELLAPLFQEPLPSNAVSIKNTSSPSSLILSKAELIKFPSALRIRAYKHALDTLGTGQVLSETLFKLDRAWEEKRGKTSFQFSNGKLATLHNQSIIFEKK